MKLLKAVSLLFMVFFLCVNANAQHHNFHNIPSLEPRSFFPLKKAIADARIVLIGEPDHLHGNIFTTKTEVVKFLHENMGFDIIAFESGFYDLEKSHEVIQNGTPIKEAYLNSIFPIWTYTQEFQPFLNYAIDNYTTLKLVGFDSQFSGNYAESTLKEDYLKYFASEEEYNKWYDYVKYLMKYDFPDHLSYKDFDQRNTNLMYALVQSDTEKSEDLLQTVKNISGSAFDYHFNKISHKTIENFEAKDSNLRDKMMGKNLIYLAKKYPNKKIIVWGATGHLMNKINEDIEGLNEFNPMGSYIKKEFGNEAYILAFTGRLDGFYSEDNIEDEFYATGNKYGFLNLTSSDTFSSSMLSTESGDAVVTDWSKVVDGFFFVHELVPITENKHLDEVLVNQKK